MTGNQVTYSGLTGVVLPNATCSQNNITGTGTVNGDTMNINNTGEVDCSVMGIIPVSVTVTSSSVFTRTGPKITLCRLCPAALDAAPTDGLDASLPVQTDPSARYNLWPQIQDRNLGPWLFDVGPDSTQIDSRIPAFDHARPTSVLPRVFRIDRANQIRRKAGKYERCEPGPRYLRPTSPTFVALPSARLFQSMPFSE